jgi:hypothetical protein
MKQRGDGDIPIRKMSSAPEIEKLGGVLDGAIQQIDGRPNTDLARRWR